MTVLHNIYFSAKGTTKKYSELIGENLNMETKSYDWFHNPCENPLEIPRQDVVFLSMPVYGGFIPNICIPMVEKLRGNHTPAIIAAVYGNRHYDDALLQMKELLTEQGFVVVAAGAFIAEHSVFPSVATGRPDEKDKAAMKEFAIKCKEILSKETLWENKEIEVPGTPGYDGLSYPGLPFKPQGAEACTRCGACVNACPMNAISMDDPCKTNPELCISCGACISACPTGARKYHGSQFEAVRADFEKMCAEYRTPKTYYIV